MDVWEYVKVIGAVFTGNLLTIGTMYFYWCAHEREKKGLNPYDVGIGPILVGAIGPLVTIGAVWMMKP